MYYFLSRIFLVCGKENIPMIKRSLFMFQYKKIIFVIVHDYSLVQEIVFISLLFGLSGNIKDLRIQK